MRTLGLLSFVMLLGVACDSSSSSPTTPMPITTSPSPPPEAMVRIERVNVDIGVAFLPQPQLVILYDLLITETAGVGVTLRNAQLEIFDPQGARFANDRVMVDRRIPANGSERVDVEWRFSVNPNRQIGDIVTTYRFVDDNAYTKELQLSGNETDVSGLRRSLSQIEALP